MKKILITGSNSYIGTNVEKWLLREPEKYIVETLDMKDENWNQFDFSGFDVVFHVAGIAHIKETKRNKDLYYKVNRDLAYQAALKAKESGVKQFIFLSSMSVYGMETGIITKDTTTNPKTAYGRSKLDAEKLIQEIETSEFKVAILRPPMVYGPDSPGNYQRLSKLALKLPFYPKINNQRSMLYIDNLSIYIKRYIDSNAHGIFFPQNKEYVNTTELISLIRKSHGKKCRETKLFNWMIYLLKPIVLQISKIFGTLYYQYDEDSICLINFPDSIEMIEKEK
ncbi:NAD-dependent epimerase/dehydratase family protein [Acholeplasma laidlawii]|uniref:NAD-dependent epimerase/dehydratase family protein n=1 Tax=Acholeplasma laidlawii TaxID=2148 RepID=UPI0018C1E52E|nr:NAD-dependent epimerase/dehydratase family protein [Acholeplasma laidlawii]MBG0763199.1 NAD-dependent epimerase/dehydratase family protein [Acholeplasma laidlawii]